MEAPVNHGNPPLWVGNCCSSNRSASSGTFETLSSTTPTRADTVVQSEAQVPFEVSVSQAGGDTVTQAVGDGENSSLDFAVDNPDPMDTDESHAVPTSVATAVTYPKEPEASLEHRDEGLGDGDGAAAEEASIDSPVCTNVTHTTAVVESASAKAMEAAGPESPKNQHTVTAQASTTDSDAVVSSTGLEREPTRQRLPSALPKIASSNEMPVVESSPLKAMASTSSPSEEPSPREISSSTLESDSIGTMASASSERPRTLEDSTREKRDFASTPAAFLPPANAMSTTYADETNSYSSSSSGDHTTSPYKPSEDSQEASDTADALELSSNASMVESRPFDARATASLQNTTNTKKSTGTAPEVIIIDHTPPKRTNAKRKKKPSSVFAKLEDPEVLATRDRNLAVGSRVYCKWGEDSSGMNWYWATVREKHRGDPYHTYAVDFDDGDSLSDTGIQDMISVPEYRDFFSDEPPPAPKRKKTGPPLQKEAENAATTNTTPETTETIDADAWRVVHHLYRRQCGKCAMCHRDSCGQCFVCREGRDRTVCVQKMCLEIRGASKAQKAPGLPLGWKFFFEKTEPDFEPYKGLVIVPPATTNGEQYYTLEGAISNEKNVDGVHDEVSFYKHVGLPDVIKQSSIDETTQDTTIPEHGTGWSLQEIYQQRCGRCYNCLKTKCRSCFACQSGQSLCIRQMCRKISVEDKAQSAPGLPRGWKYVFEGRPIVERLQNLDGLGVIPTNKKMYSSVAKALCYCPNAKVKEADFYRHVGLDKTFPKLSGGRGASANEPDCAPEAGNDADHVFTPQELFAKRCDDCYNCQKHDCDLCRSCQTNKSHRQGAPLCCLRKMCCRIPTRQKARSAPGLPVGWTYMFEGPPSKRFKNFDGLTIFGPNKATYGSLSYAMRHKPGGLADEADFYRHVGLFEMVLKSQTAQERLGLFATNTQLHDDDDDHDQSTLQESPSDSNNIYTPEELTLERCDECYNCKKDACGQCNSCKENGTRRKGVPKCCLRKMCCALGMEAKARPAPGLPRGWKFVFLDAMSVGHKHHDGLRIVTTNGAQYSSLKNAMRHSESEKASCDEVAFYTYVGLQHKCSQNNYGGDSGGLPDTTEVGDHCYCRHSNDHWYWGTIVAKKGTGKNTIFSIKFDDGEELDKVSYMDVCTKARFKESYPDERIPDPPESGLDFRDPGEGDTAITPQSNGIKHVPGKSDISRRWDPAQLYQHRCGHCSQCAKEDCGDCSTCLKNKRQARSLREVCLKKMCRLIPDERKAQDAVGFPVGWTFVFRDPKDCTLQNSQPGLEGLCISSPNGRIYRSAESVQLGGSTEEEKNRRINSFHKHVGASLYRDDASHFLVGKPYCHQWSDVSGAAKVVYGRILSSSTKITDPSRKHFTVEFSEDSLNVVNSVGSDGGPILPVPKKLHKLCSSTAFGGWRMYKTKTRANDESDEPEESIFSLSWILPETRLESFEESGEGLRLPKLALVVRGFYLEFKVKESRIPNAGNGLFVRCRSLVDTDRQMFELEAGDMIDLGRYAPFRREDVKTEVVFLVKNFIHSSKCEAWQFETRAEGHFSFDITDDATGDLHELAKSRCLAYVNETDGEMPPSVRAEHAPDGSVHYLLGHDDPAHGTLKLPLDGTEVELLIDYGENYEDVRFRKGYPRQQGEALEKRAERLEEEDDHYIHDFRNFSGPDVLAVVKFLTNILDEKIHPNQPNRTALKRAFIVAVAIKKRARYFQDNVSDEMVMRQNEVTETLLDDVLEMTSDLVTKLRVSLWKEKDHEMKRAILANDLYRQTLEDFLGESPAELHPGTLRKRLDTL